MLWETLGYIAAEQLFPEAHYASRAQIHKSEVVMMNNGLKSIFSRMFLSVRPSTEGAQARVCGRPEGQDTHIPPPNLFGPDGSTLINKKLFAAAKICLWLNRNAFQPHATVGHKIRSGGWRHFGRRQCLHGAAATRAKARLHFSVASKWHAAPEHCAQSNHNAILPCPMSCEVLATIDDVSWPLLAPAC
jgi:hypothetical protein